MLHDHSSAMMPGTGSRCSADGILTAKLSFQFGQAHLWILYHTWNVLPPAHMSQTHLTWYNMAESRHVVAMCKQVSFHYEFSKWALCLPGMCRELMTMIS